MTRLEHATWEMVDGVDGDPIREHPALALYAGGSRFALLWHSHDGMVLGRLPSALEHDPQVVRLVGEFEAACRAGQFEPKPVWP